ncbi:GDP-mannose 4,6-dehydratase [Planctomicrobium piriforme]|uniref:GDP-mannose 4,6-dehydratase n=1 Tax=Planctomicrobium piriforme TaxID=1576369 RepID=A0A1I3BGX7_9PLAN|nr:GDP-mannose 4,6-dehydratase [Planctomicrobium piriforme]SFH61547.1 GDPmannose 4,6-dehydratase [Planctomicrobium piriforme]
MPTSSPKRVLITGITGQDGSYLAELLAERGDVIWGFVRQIPQPGSWIDPLLKPAGGKPPRVKLIVGDLADEGSVRRAVGSILPEEIYHLAAQSHVPQSQLDPESTLLVSMAGTSYLLDAIDELTPESRFFHASSAEIFGDAVSSPQNEKTPLSPRNPYGSGKAFATHLVRTVRDSRGTFAVNGICFNHESPRRGPNFVTRKIAMAAARIALGRQDSVSLGNLNARRDWGFAGDFVKAMWLSLQAEQGDDYIFATGVTRTVREFCEQAFQSVGLPLTWSGVEKEEVGLDDQGIVRMRIEPEFYRPLEAVQLVGDASKAAKELGWKAETGFNEIVAKMCAADLDRERAQIENEPEKIG